MPTKNVWWPYRKMIRVERDADGTPRELVLEHGSNVVDADDLPTIAKLGCDLEVEIARGDWDEAWIRNEVVA